MTGYKLYRGTAAGIYGAPTALGNVTTYTDATAVTGTRYYYAVSAVDAAGNEGAKSPEAAATALDNTPPATPTGLAATPGIGSIALSWNANTEPDLLGYNVYYNGIKHNALPVTSTTYTHFGLAGVDGLLLPHHRGRHRRRRERAQCRRHRLLARLHRAGTAGVSRLRSTRRATPAARST